MVRKVFLLAILACALFYTWSAYMNLSFLSSTGRLGPGFFPRILGTLAVVVMLYTLFFDRKPEHGETLADESDPETGLHPRAAVIAIGLTGLMIALFHVLGGVTAMVLFLAVTLWIFNPRGHLTNAAVTLGVPLAVYLMFDVWLNASMPRGMFPFLI